MVPGRVVAVAVDTCTVEIGERLEEVSSFAEPDLGVGDWVVVNGGTVVRRLEPDQAMQMARAFSLAAGPRAVALQGDEARSRA